MALLFSDDNFKQRVWDQPTAVGAAPHERIPSETRRFPMVLANPQIGDMTSTMALLFSYRIITQTQLRRCGA
jgi:hypothetical protein